MKANIKKLKELSESELNVKLKELKNELFNLRFQNAVGQLANPMQIEATRREIARIKTVLQEKALGKKA